MNIKELRDKLKKNPRFRNLPNEKSDLAFEIGQAVLEERVRKGWTQTKLAREIGTKQPSIARVEGGATLPTPLMLKKIAEALGGRLEISIKGTGLRFTIQTNSSSSTNKTSDIINLPSKPPKIVLAQNGFFSSESAEQSSPAYINE